MLRAAIDDLRVALRPEKIEMPRAEGSTAMKMEISSPPALTPCRASSATLFILAARPIEVELEGMLAHRTAAGSNSRAMTRKTSPGTSWFGFYVARLLARGVVVVSAMTSFKTRPVLALSPATASVRNTSVQAVMTRYLVSAITHADVSSALPCRRCRFGYRNAKEVALRGSMARCLPGRQQPGPPLPWPMDDAPGPSDPARDEMTGRI